MANQENFERQAQAITERYQAEIDMKTYLAHWGGYKDVKARHKKELQELAQKYEVTLNFKKWKLNGHWM